MNFLNRFHRQQEKEGATNGTDFGEQDDENEELKHSDSYERSGRVDPDEDLLEVGEYAERNLLDERVNEHDDAAEEAHQVRERQ